MTATEPARGIAPPEFNIFDNAVLLNVNIGLPGNHRRVASEGIDVDADRDWISVSKRLVESEEFDGICKAVNKFKGWVKGKCIFPKSSGSGRPALRKLLKPGVYLLPLGLVAEVDEAVDAFREVQWLPRIEKFLEAYPRLKERAKEHLKGEYCETDYPEVGQLRASFYLDTCYVSIGTPKSLERISKGMLDRERSKQAAQLGDVYGEVRQVLRAGFQELVAWMVRSLEPTDSGKKRAFKASSVDRFMQFLSDFQAKNLTGDSDLEPLVDEAKKILGGLSGDALRSAVKSEDYREDLAERFKTLQTKLAPLVDEQNDRMVLIED